MRTVMPIRVQYHGSIEDAHGEYRVVGECDCYEDECDGRLELDNGARTLNHVRLASVTALD